LHEYSIVQVLLERAEDAAATRSAMRVAHLRLAIGSLAGVEEQLLRTAFQMARVGTTCAAAELEIRRIDPRWQCRDCGRAVVAGGVLRCPDCGAPARLVAGAEIVLESLELEVA